MSSEKYHIAQVNVALMRSLLNDPLMAEFVASLDEVNAIADRAAGFVWRLQTDEGNATQLRPYDDERILFNLSVWGSIEELQKYVYQGAHGAIMRKRRQWFEKFAGMHVALWWVKAGDLPSIAEAKERLDYLNLYGASQFSFDFKHPFPPPNVAAEEFSVPPCDPCPAA